MKYIYKTIIFWILSVLFTAVIAIYQRASGPTYPVKGSVTINNEEIKYKLIRTDTTYIEPDSSEIKIKVLDNTITGSYNFRRYKSHDKWMENNMAMLREDSFLIANIPRQDTAGKIEYKITLIGTDKEYLLEEDPIVMRYKGDVPKRILYPHIFLMFFAMLFSTRTGIEVLIKGKYVFLYTTITLLLLIPGGMILGPIVQHYAFGAYWTGWPWGTDLTDNKTAIAFLGWIVAFILILFGKGKRKGWALVASIVLLMVYLIPHSMFGSEIDHTESEGENIEVVE
ncbi:hypothetical protein ACFLQ5_03115 [Bacteroidota bacterium]